MRESSNRTGQGGTLEAILESSKPEDRRITIPKGGPSQINNLHIEVSEKGVSFKSAVTADGRASSISGNYRGRLLYLNAGYKWEKNNKFEFEFRNSRR